MIWFVIIPLLVVAAFVAVYAPYHTVREAKRLRLRGDGTDSESRKNREKSHRKRMIRDVVAAPLVITLALTGAMFLLDAFIPSSPIAEIMGGVSSETATVSAELQKSLEEELAAQMREERRVEERDTLNLLDAKGQTSMEFFTTHWPLRVVFLFVVTALLYRMNRRVMKARQAYDRGVGERRREYAKLDMKALDEATGLA